MRRMIAAGLLMAFIAFIAGSVSSVVAAELQNGAPPTGAIHQSVSLVTHVDRAAGVLVIKLESGRFIRLLVNEATVGDSLATLDPGDVISERCTHMTDGVARALQIRRVRTASAELESIEK